MKNFKLEKFLWFFQLETGAESIGYFGLVIGWLIVIADTLELTGSLECTQRPLDVCQLSKIGKLFDVIELNKIIYNIQIDFDRSLLHAFLLCSPDDHNVFHACDFFKAGKDIFK